MRTLDELIHYCNEDDPVGALMLTGEWGSGKTFVVERNLTKALKDTHIFIRVSTFGMDNTKALQHSIRQKWLEACMPVLGSLQRAKDKGFFSAFSAAMKKFNPIAGSAADVIVSMNMLDYVTIKPEVEDFITHEKKKVILVYDDLERSRINPAELMGVINDYCENKKFNTIIIVNEKALLEEWVKDRITYHMLREKTISQTLYHIPDYEEVINAIVRKGKWETPEYAEYLEEHKDLIQDVFMSESEKMETIYLTDKDRKYHNFRTLTKGIHSFFRIYYHIKESGNEVDDSHFYSFLAYYLATKCGIFRDGMPCIEVDDNTIKEFYPRFSRDELTDIECCWIATGIWDGEAFAEEMAKR